MRDEQCKVEFLHGHGEEPLIEARERNCTLPSSKVRALDPLLALSPHLTDKAKLDRVVPHIVDLLHDDAAIVRASALRTLMQLMGLRDTDAAVVSVTVITPSDAAIFRSTSYRLFRTWSAIQKPRCGACGSYDASMQEPHNSIQEHLSTLLIDPSSVFRHAVLYIISSLCMFLGRQKTNDVLLSHMITCMNDSDWLLRYAFFDCIVDVTACEGGRSLEEYIFPLMIQSLFDAEGTVAASACFAGKPLRVEVVSEEKMQIWELMSATLGFLYYPDAWIRAAAFIAPVAKQLPPSALCFIMLVSTDVESENLKTASGIELQKLGVVPQTVLLEGRRSISARRSQPDLSLGLAWITAPPAPFRRPTPASCQRQRTYADREYRWTEGCICCWLIEGEFHWPAGRARRPKRSVCKKRFVRPIWLRYRPVVGAHSCVLQHRINPFPAADGHELRINSLLEHLYLNSICELQNALAFRRDHRLGYRKRAWVVCGTLTGVLSLWDIRFGISMKSWKVAAAAKNKTTRIYQCVVHPARGKGKSITVAMETLKSASRQHTLFMVWDIEQSVLVESFVKRNTANVLEEMEEPNEIPADEAETNRAAAIAALMRSPQESGGSGESFTRRARLSRVPGLDQP
ncbi:ARM repeat-containing protein [Laetiporus sulphureus 93-53]|uniref:ARM repeat-containing protein n=1 Tax=Laetiporus sulphureus 93-53 TaxID=1314785 RepID=A0A165ASK8_9APHY|nr:ARM repeat-containing protein [Laetiporus sulphureus 93-53]KZS99582.1 ARM repeat-containing protein [Laetiporus sulphureus 93-53]